MDKDQAVIKSRSIRKLLGDTFGILFSQKRVILPIAFGFILPFELVVLYLNSRIPQAPAILANLNEKQMINLMLTGSDAARTQIESYMSAISFVTFTCSILDFLVVVPILYGTITYFVTKLRVSGTREELGNVTTYGLTRWIPLGMTNVLFALCAIAILFVLLMVFEILPNLTAVASVLAIVCALVFIWGLVRLSLSWAVVSIEKVSGFQAMKRSIELTKGFFWRTLWFQLLVSLIVYVVLSVLQYALSALFIHIIGTILFTLVVVLLLPLIVIGNAELYVDLRTRREKKIS